MNVADLLKAAAKATPDVRPCRSKWAQVFPVYQQLRSNGFSRRDAVKWLVDKGAVENGDVQKGIRSLDSLTLRRKGKGRHS